MDSMPSTHKLHPHMLQQDHAHGKSPLLISHSIVGPSTIVCWHELSQVGPYDSDTLLETLNGAQ